MNPDSLEVPAAVRFISAEPLLEETDLSNYLCNFQHQGVNNSYLDWVIVGGESGFQARPCQLSWLQLVVQQCQRHEVPVFVKQLGSVWAKASCTYSLDNKGGNPEAWLEELRVREFPLLAKSDRFLQAALCDRGA